MKTNSSKKMKKAGICEEGSSKGDGTSKDFKNLHATSVVYYNPPKLESLGECFRNDLKKGDFKETFKSVFQINFIVKLLFMYQFTA